MKFSRLPYGNLFVPNSKLLAVCVGCGPSYSHWREDFAPGGNATCSAGLTPVGSGRGGRSTFFSSHRPHEPTSPHDNTTMASTSLSTIKTAAYFYDKAVALDKAAGDKILADAILEPGVNVQTDVARFCVLCKEKAREEFKNDPERYVGMISNDDDEASF